MSTPGISLFQGAESIKVNTSFDRAQEEEELEDQKRRNEELENLLQNAFDDLQDDETTVDSTSNFQMDMQETNHVNHEQDQQNIIHTAQKHIECEQQIHKLKMLLSSRTHELENIKKIANEEMKKRDEFQKRLTISSAELDRALSAKKNTHELLVESKEKCSNLENTIGKLRNEKKSLECENNTLIGKLETTQMLLSDAQHKYDMVARDLNINNEQKSEMKRKQMEERHKAEIEVFQQQMEQIQKKLEKKTIELENMHTRYNTLQNNHEMMIVDKANKISDLNHALNEANHRYEESLQKVDYTSENVRLQKLVNNLQEQIKIMENTIVTLNERLERTNAELNLMDTVLQQHQTIDDTPLMRLSQTNGKIVGSTPLNTIERIGNLKEELCRALSNVKSKRDEINKLNLNLQNKDIAIRKLKEEENNLLVQFNIMKEEKSRLENRLKLLEQDYANIQNQNKKTEENQEINESEIKIKALNIELENLRSEKNRLVEECKNLENERDNHEIECKKLDVQLKNVQVDLEELNQEYEELQKENQQLRSRTTADNVRLELEKHKFLLNDAKAECDRLKNLYVEISNAKEALTYELDTLRNTDNIKELHEQREKVATLQRALKLAELKAIELTKMLETEKMCNERELNELRTKIEKDKTENLKTAKETVNECTKCLDYLAEITKFEIQNLKLNSINAVSKKEIDSLKTDLIEANAQIVELTDRLELTQEQDQLIKELKIKASQFEEYIKSHSNSSDKSSVLSPKSQKQQNLKNKSVATSPEFRRADVKKIESRVRDEMAKIFAIELKCYQLKIQKVEDQFVSLQREHQRIIVELQERQNEVDVLKEAILAEREQMEEIMKEKVVERENALQKHNALLLKCRNELSAKTQKLNELTKELNERQTQIEAERQSMKAVMTQWEEQRKNLDDVEIEWKNKLIALQKKQQEILETWEKKYTSAKRTIANYKRYAEDKEAHMLKEYERLKNEYDASVNKIEMHMKDVIEKRAREREACKICKTKTLNGNFNAEQQKAPLAAVDKENQINK